MIALTWPGEAVVQNSERILAISAAAGAGMQVGGAIAATRMVVHDVGPFSLALLRYAIALACLLPFAWGTFKSARSTGRIAALLMLGMIQFGLLMALLNVGLLFLPAASAAIIFSTLPLATLIIAWALGRETITLSSLWAIGLVMTGVCLAVGPHSFAEDGLQFLMGSAAVVGATLCGAIASILYRDHVAGTPVLFITVTGLAAAVAFLLPPAMLELYAMDFALPSARHWPTVILIGTSSAAGFYLWIFALARTTATIVGICVATAPISATVMGMLLLAESPDRGAFFGLLCVVIALFLLYRQPTKERPGP